MKTDKKLSEIEAYEVLLKQQQKIASEQIDIYTKRLEDFKTRFDVGSMLSVTEELSYYTILKCRIEKSLKVIHEPIPKRGNKTLAQLDKELIHEYLIERTYAFIRNITNLKPEHSTSRYRLAEYDVERRYIRKRLGILLSVIDIKPEEKPLRDSLYTLTMYTV